MGWTRHPNHPDAAVRYFEDDGRLVRQVVQNVDSALDANRRESNETQGWTPTRRMRKAASIPATIYYDWIAEWDRKGELPAMTDPGREEAVRRKCLERVRDRDFNRFKI